MQAQLLQLNVTLKLCLFAFKAIVMLMKISGSFVQKINVIRNYLFVIVFKP